MFDMLTELLQAGPGWGMRRKPKPLFEGEFATLLIGILAVCIFLPGVVVLVLWLALKIFGAA